MTPNISPKCRKGNHVDCVWFEVSADFKRTYWCDCDCHQGGTVLDLTGAPADVGTERELVSQE